MEVEPLRQDMGLLQGIVEKAIVAITEEEIRRGSCRRTGRALWSGIKWMETEGSHGGDDTSDLLIQDVDRMKLFHLS